MPVLQPQLPHHLPQRLDREVGRAEVQGRLSSQHLDFRQQGDVSQFIQIIKEAKRVTYSVPVHFFLMRIGQKTKQILILKKQFGFLKSGSEYSGTPDSNPWVWIR